MTIRLKIITVKNRYIHENIDNNVVLKVKCYPSVTQQGLPIPEWLHPICPASFYGIPADPDHHCFLLNTDIQLLWTIITLPINIYIYTFIYIYTYIHTCTIYYISMYMHIHVCINIYIYIIIYIYTYIYIYIHNYMCIYIYNYIYTYMYVFEELSNLTKPSSPFGVLSISSHMLLSPSSVTKEADLNWRIIGVPWTVAILGKCPCGGFLSHGGYPQSSVSVGFPIKKNHPSQWVAPWKPGWSWRVILAAHVKQDLPKWGVPSMGGTPKYGWFMRDNPIKMDDLGLLPFMEPPKSETDVT